MDEAVAVADSLQDEAFCAVVEEVVWSNSATWG